MNVSQTIFRTSLQFGVRLVSAAVGFLTTIILARVLGAANFGVYATALSYIGFFYVILDFGLNQIFLRDSQEKHMSIAGFLGLRLIMSLVLGIVAACGIMVLGVVNPVFSGELTQLMYILLFSLPAQAMILTTQAVFWHRQQFFLLSLGVLIANVITLMLIFTQQDRIIQKGNVLGVWFFVIGLWVAAVWGTVWVRTHMRGWILESRSWMALLRESWPLGVTLFFNIIYFRIDLFLLAAFGKGSEVGVYSLAYKFFEFALVIPTFLMNSIYPDLLRDRAFFHTSLNRFMKLCTLAGVVVALVMWVGAPLVGLVKYEYSASIWLLRLLSVSIPLFFITSPLQWRYILEKKQQRLSLIYGGSLVFNIVVNLLLIPSLGAQGAAITTILSEGMVLVGLWYFQNS